jgi:hypothetical protein
MNRNQAIRNALCLTGILVASGAGIQSSSAQILKPYQPSISLDLSLERQKEQEKLPEHLLLLTQAKVLNSSAIGAAAVRTELYKAFERAAVDGDSIRPQLETMVQSATPAGRIYAAILLRKIDRLAGETALKQLQSDQASVTYWSGCMGENYKVGELATKILLGEMSL